MFQESLTLPNVHKFIEHLDSNYNIGPSGRLNKRQAIVQLLGYLIIDENTGQDEYFK
jgi:hypothetical protein